ncbi:MAG: hypothetical protein JJ896_16310 [Rhodothermales bacterium]|nr:hypothetical protein [Rhodothermales bacterium]MBO6781220.1 hypothetical protein [Rhodothermales bacterium]
MARSNLVKGLFARRAERAAVKRFARCEQRTGDVLAIAPTLRTQAQGALVDIARSPEATLERRVAAMLELTERTLGMRPYPVQIAAGLALLEGHMVQMDTGEGKTLAAVIPAALLAMEHGATHVLTFNTYLAERDAAWMGAFYRALGLTVGAVSGDPDARRHAYACDITYATAKEACFDLLRDHRAFSQAERLHRPLRAAIVDEADSILIDEARIPLVLAADRERSGTDPARIARLVADLEPGSHYEQDATAMTVDLTDRGLQHLERQLGIDSLHDPSRYLLLTELNQALHAAALLTRDEDYIVRDARIEIVDPLTGRVVPDRRWPDGLQAAVEAKEGVPIQPGGRILERITMQHFLEHYPARAGMTATAVDAAEEFEEGYGMPVVVVPPHRPSGRDDLVDSIFATTGAKERALADRVHAMTRRERPVLVGTASVAESERIQTLLRDRGTDCAVLNARNDREEAAIIADAGLPGRVTVSTNMAGRGTDIRLGGHDEALREQVVRAGGLHVIGTTRHESRRIDRQLRGRAGRQGDPGSSEFLICLEDAMMERFEIDELVPKQLRSTLQRTRLQHPMVQREVDRVQRIADSRNREIRGTTARYSAVLEQQRKQASRIREPFVHEAPEPIGRLTAEHTRRLYLDTFDTLWADHLALAADIEEGVHLVRLGGLDPLREYNKQLAEAFRDFEERLHQEVAERAARAAQDPPPGPGSTWAYLVSDRAGSPLQNMLFGSGAGAISAVGAAMLWPVLMMWGWRERRRRRD